MTKIDIVDNNDKIIKTIEENEFNPKTDICRGVVIFILNSEKKILLQQRSKKEDSYPLHYDCSAGGGLNLGENYIDGAYRELNEEIGIKTELKLLAKDLYKYPNNSYEFVSNYIGNYNKTNFKLEKNEVESIEFFSIEEIKKMIKNKKKFHPQCLFLLKKYFL